eukprot:g35780.t1
MSGFDYVALHGSSAGTSSTFGKVLRSAIGLSSLVLAGAGAYLFRHSGQGIRVRVLWAGGSGEQGSLFDKWEQPFRPKEGVQHVLVKPYPVPGLPALLSPPSSNHLHSDCLFLSHQQFHRFPAEIGKDAMKQEAWLYGAKLEVGHIAHPTGRVEDVVQGQSLCWIASLFEQRLQQSDEVHGYDAKKPNATAVTRWLVNAVLRDGTAMLAHSYFQRPAAVHTHDKHRNVMLLVDGSSYLYRAFHALPDLRGPNGEPTGVIQGMVSMLKKLREQVKADHAVCVFDSKGKTFRHELFEEYKATRASMPDALREQIGAVHEAVELLGWPVVSVPGVEADDAIGTLARVASDSGHQVIISTSDKDMAQLVTHSVSIINTMSNERLDERGVKEKFGVSPSKMADYLCLVGDTSDNIPGVKMVGPKTAVKWLTEYGSLDAIVSAADQIKGAVGNNLREALDWLPQGRRLVTIVTDVDMSGHVQGWPELNALALRAEDCTGLLSFYERYGMNTFRKELLRKQNQKGTAKENDCAGDAKGNNQNHRAVPGNKQNHRAVPTTTPSAAKPNISSSQSGGDGQVEYETITTEEQLAVWLAKLDGAELVALDTETDSLDVLRAKIVGISFAVRLGQAAYVPINHTHPNASTQLPLATVLDRLRPWLENPDKHKLGQNIKYDLHVFANAGVVVQGYMHDTMLQSYVLESHHQHNLESLGQRHLGRTAISYEEICGKGAKQIPFSQVAVDVATRYSGEDSEMALHVHQKLWHLIEQDSDTAQRHIYEKIEMPVVHVLLAMERQGVLIDSEVLSRQSEELVVRLAELEDTAHRLANQTFNIASPKQVGEVLFDKLGLPTTKKTATGAYSTDEKVLTELAVDHPVAAAILEHRGLSKLKSTFVDKLPAMINPQTGRVHTNYAQAVAVTGRLASSQPNLQNIPIRAAEGRRIREAFIAPPGHVIVSADYSQIELRIMAHISEDPALLAAFAAGADVHAATASEVFNISREKVTSEQRSTAKMINFGLMYGMGTYGLASRLGIKRKVATEYIKTYFARFQGVKRYMEEIRDQAMKKGYVETVFGRRLWIPEIKSTKPAVRGNAERQAINAPMQGTAADLIKLAMGTAADLIKLAMVAVDAEIQKQRLGSRIVMQVHDELVLEVPEAETDWAKTSLPRLMSEVADLKVPLVAEVGVGENWEKAH